MSLSPPAAMRAGAAFAVPLCLLASGAAGLAYEVVWARYLALFVGSAAITHTVVLSTFMGGLALGGWLFGRAADRARRPLALYGLLELGIAASALLLPWLVDAVGRGYAVVAAPFAGNAGALAIFRALVAAAVVAPPAILMGGTLPLAARFYVRALSEVGAGVGRLYFVNSAGAVAGTISAGFFLVPAFGLDGTLWVAASLNVLAAVVALLVSARSERPQPSVAPSPEGAPSGSAPEESPYPAWVARTVLVAVCVSGAAAMAYEIVWLRILTLVLGGSAYAFSTMLAAFILGIAIGSAFVGWRRLGLHRDPLRWFAGIEIAVGVVSIALVPLYSRLPWYYLQVSKLIARTEEAYPVFLTAGFLVCVAAMLVPTVLLGATFPLAAQLATRSMRSLGGGVGRTYAFNTAGSLSGTILAAHAGLPALGLYGTLAAAAILNVAAGVGCLAGSWRTRDAAAEPSRGTLRLRAATVGLVLALFPAWIAVGPRIERSVLTVGVFRHLEYDFANYSSFVLWAKSGVKTVLDVDGADATVTVYDIEGYRSMNVNGKADASSGPDVGTQYFVGHLPALLHPAPKKSLVVGLGSGATAAALLAHPENHVTSVEISPEIVDAARLFEEVNRGVLDDPRHTLVIDDVKAFLRLSREKYDVIVSVPSNPWVAGNASLFSVEFLELVKEHLADGGVFAQWFQGYEITDEVVRVILKTFSASGVEYELFHAGRGADFVLVGGPRNPGAWTRDFYDRRGEEVDRRIVSRLEVREDLARLSIRTSAGIRARRLHCEPRVFDGSRTNRERRPVLDFIAPIGVFLSTEPSLLQGCDRRSYLKVAFQPHGDVDVSADEVRRIAEEAYENLAPPFSRSRLEYVRRWARHETDAGVRRLLAAELYAQERFEESVDVSRSLVDEESATAEDRLRLQLGLVRLLGAGGNAAGVAVAAAALEQAVVAVDTAGAWVEVAAAWAGAGRYELAAAAWERAAERTPPSKEHDRVRRLARAGEAWRLAGESCRAIRRIEDALRHDPTHWLALVEQVAIGERGEAGSCPSPVADRPAGARFNAAGP